MTATELRPPPRHVAIIMDGNGRWAKKRGLMRAQGHRKGVEAVRRTVRAAIESGLGYLTLFSFSSENWSRPEAEVADLMGLLRRFIQRDLADLHQNNVRIRVIGSRDGVAADIVTMIAEAEKLTERNSGLVLIVAFNYGGRSEIARASKQIAREVADGRLKPEDVTPELIGGRLDTAGIPDPDLVIRTSGEQRISNFLLWQCAYSELLFIDAYWPDFDGELLQQAINQYRTRDRRFGGLASGAQIGS